MSTDEMLRQAMDAYGDMVFRLCLITLQNRADAEDAVQDVFMTYYTKKPDFSSGEHEKAWLLTVASNRCRDMLRARKRRRTEPEELLDTFIQEPEESHIMEALMELPEKFRTVMELHYIEGFKVDEIAKMLGKTSSAIKMRLSKGRKLLENIYRKEYA